LVVVDPSMGGNFGRNGIDLDVGHYRDSPRVVVVLCGINLNEAAVAFASASDSDSLFSSPRS